MTNSKEENQLLIQLSLKLIKLGHEVEGKKNTLRALHAKGIDETTYENAAPVFRALDEFNVANMEYREIEKQYLTLKSKIAKNK